MHPHDKAEWLHFVGDDVVQEIPISFPWRPDCGEIVPGIFRGKEADAEALCPDYATILGLTW